MTPEEQRIALAQWDEWRRWKFGDPWPKGLLLKDKRFNGYLRRVIKNAPAESKTVMLDIDETWTQQVEEVIANYIPASHWISPKGKVSRKPPDYLNDLNAVHELVWKLTFEQAEQFEDQLCDIAVKYNEQRENPAPWRFAVANATAAQRCEALLKTLNLWKP